MTTGLDVAKKAVAFWQNVHGTESLDQQCQRFSGYYWIWAYQGGETGILGYGSARAAYQASKIENLDINSAPVGSNLFWDAAPYDHVGDVVGYDGNRAVVAYATRFGDTIAELGNGVKLSHADTYPHKFKGWSYANGKNRATSGLTDYNAQPLQGNQRVAVSPLGANGREDATSQSALKGGVLAGKVGNFDGWKHGESVNGNDIWFHGAISGAWFWSGGFTDTAVHDLTDMNPVVIDPKARMVRGSTSANARLDPSTQQPGQGTGLLPNRVVDMVAFAHGQKVSNVNVPDGTDIWYFDGTYWYWAGGFTTIDTSGLVDRSAEFTPPPAIVMASFGIDLDSSRADFDFAKAKAEGVDWVGIKMGGHNTSKQAIESHYGAMVDAAHAAGHRVLHYYVSGKGDPVDEAKFVAANLHGFALDSDGIMADNEQFGHGPNGDQNVNSTIWDDDFLATFFMELRLLTRAPYTRMVHNFNEQVHSTMDYSKTESLGVQNGPANYYSNPTTRVAQNVPTLTKTWWATQFSSQQTVAGVSPVDGWWSDKTVDQLFARGDVLEDSTEPTQPTDGGTTTPPTTGGDTPSTPSKPETNRGGIIAAIVTLVTMLAGFIAAVWPWH
ncbi:hypothetical protein [Pseudolysinimonas sp.]|uniref:hypothetical protein n=1 Tax=Pseudolysinimonas sp. TaxID=2680009 RepID=UPI003F7F4FB8